MAEARSAVAVAVAKVSVKALALAAHVSESVVLAGKTSGVLAIHARAAGVEASDTALSGYSEVVVVTHAILVGSQ